MRDVSTRDKRTRPASVKNERRRTKRHGCRRRKGDLFFSSGWEFVRLTFLKSGAIRGLRLVGTETRNRNVAILGYRSEKRRFFSAKPSSEIGSAEQ